jgi:hypothetical protein
MVVFVCLLAALASPTVVMVYNGSPGYKAGIQQVQKISPFPVRVIYDAPLDWCTTILLAAPAPSKYRKWRHKLFLWSLPYTSIIFLDSDVVVYGDLNKLADLNRRNPMQLFMSLDGVNGQNLNSGIMVFSPQPGDQAMMKGCMTGDTIVTPYSDQEIIAMCFSKAQRVLALGPEWGTMLKLSKDGSFIGTHWDKHAQNYFVYKQAPQALHFGWPKPWNLRSHIKNATKAKMFIQLSLGIHKLKDKSLSDQ